VTGVFLRLDFQIRQHPRGLCLHLTALGNDTVARKFPVPLLMSPLPPDYLSETP